MKKSKKIELSFAASGVLILTVIILGLIFALSFLSSNLINAFTFSPKQGQQVNFDIEGAKSLKL